mgnify:CR=1 FL=1
MKRLFDILSFRIMEKYPSIEIDETEIIEPNNLKQKAEPRIFPAFNGVSNKFLTIISSVPKL